jgi:enamine deaminase RidA (YjgF/YER057c/UK114 family)
MNDQGETGQRVLQPANWARPRGYANGIVADGETIFRRFSEGLAAQVGQALTNIVTLLAEAGAGPEHLVRLTWFVTDLRAYRENQLTIGSAYRRVIGKHFPAMSVIGVSQLVEPSALVEIEATAVLPPLQERIT